MVVPPSQSDEQKMAMASYEGYIDLIEVIKGLDYQLFRYALRTLKTKLHSSVELFSKEKMMRF